MNGKMTQPDIAIISDVVEGFVRDQIGDEIAPYVNQGFGSDMVQFLYSFRPHYEKGLTYLQNTVHKPELLANYALSRELASVQIHLLTNTVLLLQDKRKLPLEAFLAKYGGYHAVRGKKVHQGSVDAHIKLYGTKAEKEAKYTRWLNRCVELFQEKPGRTLTQIRKLVATEDTKAGKNVTYKTIERHTKSLKAEVAKISN